ncbi:MAG: ABC transporter ATP-binding protein [Thermoproteota archaeon]
MDEPLANLDAKIRVYMRAELKKLQRSLGTTIVYVTHDQVEAMSMADRVGVMSAGTLQQVASPTELYDYPGNTFVASFIGSPPMNMFYGNLTKKGERIVIDTGSFEFKLPPQIREIVERSNFSEVVLGVRPEHVMLSNRFGENVFQAKVIHIELLGRELHVHLTIGDKEIVMVTNPETELKIGDEVKITFDENKIYLFDKKNGKLIV